MEDRVSENPVLFIRAVAEDLGLGADADVLHMLLLIIGPKLRVSAEWLLL